MKPRARTPGGFSYLGLMFLIALMGLTAAMAGSAWSFAAQREQERELLFAGREYRRAIERYRQAHAGLPQPYPTALDQLLGGTDRLLPQRHLRRLYLDPMTGSSEWGLVKSPQGGIVGVYSLSTRQPVRTRGVYADESINFAKARSYRDWAFTASRTGSAAPGGAAPSDDVQPEGAPPLTWGDAAPAPAADNE